MPWYRPNGQVGGFYSAKEYREYRDMTVALHIGSFMAVGFIIIGIAKLIDWKSVGEVVTASVVILASAGLATSIVFSCIFGARRLADEVADAKDWVGYAFRMLGLLSMAFSMVGAYGAFSETPDFLLIFGIFGFIGTAAWAIIGGIVGIFYIGFKALLPVIIGIPVLYVVILLLSQGGNPVAAMISVPVIAGAYLQLLYDRQLKN